MAGRHVASKKLYKNAWFLFAAPITALFVSLAGVSGIQAIASAQEIPVLQAAAPSGTVDLVFHYEDSPELTAHQQEMETLLNELDVIESAAIITPDLETLSQVRGEAQEVLSTIQGTLTTSYKVHGVSLDTYDKYKLGEIDFQEVLDNSSGMTKEVVEDSSEGSEVVEASSEGSSGGSEGSSGGSEGSSGSAEADSLASEESPQSSDRSARAARGTPPIEIEVNVPSQKAEATLQTLTSLSQTLQEAENSLSAFDKVALGETDLLQELTDEEFYTYADKVHSPEVTAETLRRLSIQPSGLVGQSNGYIDEDLLVPLSWSPEDKMHWGAARMFELLNADFKAEMGYDLKITSAYRSYSEQIAAKEASGIFAANPGQSNHGLGLAVDIGSETSGFIDFDTLEHKWMMENGPRYGWLHPSWAGPDGSLPEAWHFEFGTYYSGEGWGFRNQSTPEYSVSWSTEAQPTK